MGLCLRRLRLQYPMQGWQVSTGIGGNLPLESVAGFDQNQWQLSTGISGNLRPEYAQRPLTGPTGHDHGASAVAGPRRCGRTLPAASPRPPEESWQTDREVVKHSMEVAWLVHLHGLPLGIVGAYLLGTQAQPVGRVVLAAVSHHQYLQLPRQLARGVPVRLPQIPRQRRPLAPPILLQLADTVPAIIADALAELLRRLPRIEQDKLRFTP
jgi:hypothetical protein